MPSAAVALEKTVHRLQRVWWLVDRFLCPATFLANKLVEFGVPDARVQPLPNFIDLRDHPQSTTSGEGWLYAGRLAIEKGVDVVIEAAKQLPGHRLQICGDGPMMQALHQQAKDLPWVEFLGHLPPARLAEALRSARVVAVPSRWYENFPYAVLEAQAAERAVVASRIGGIPEQIRDGIDGVLVPPEDATALAQAVGVLLDDPQRSMRLGKAARARIARDLDPTQHLNAIVSTYEDVLHIS